MAPIHTSAALSGAILWLTGTASSGLGEGRRFTGLPWAAEQFERKLGFAPWPGTFNLTLGGRAWRAARGRLLRGPGIVIEPPPGYCRALCYPARLADTVRGAVVIPEIDGYPPDKLELLAPVPVRETLDVRDGTPVSIEIACGVAVSADAGAVHE